MCVILEFKKFEMEISNDDKIQWGGGAKGVGHQNGTKVKSTKLRSQNIKLDVLLKYPKMTLCVVGSR